MLTVGDCREWATTLAPGSVQTIVTSPPYFGLRDYGTATWVGGDPACDHIQSWNAHRDCSGGLKNTDGRPNPKDYGTRGRQGNSSRGAIKYRGTCGKCGALRVDKQMGLEQTPDEFVANLVALFAALRPALHESGTLWCNLGDSFGPNKQLWGIPWRVAFALQADGWTLRSDVIWSKPNPMPESVRDRPTRSHEYLFLLSKKSTYFYDADAIREPHAAIPFGGKDKGYAPSGKDPHEVSQSAIRDGFGRMGNHEAGRNKRDVWTVATQPYPDAHFATFPPALIRPCILAGTSAKGACVACGAPWRRLTERESSWPARKATGGTAGNVGASATYQNGVHGEIRHHYLGGGEVKHLGWEPSCTCGTTETRPCVVADPFSGSGTTAMVAVEEGRHWVACDLDARAREWTRARLDGRQVRLDLALGAG